jgi:inosine-uridine nucleoside N-ribohydrolase
MRENFSASNIHGKSGLDGTALLPQLRPEDKPSGKKAVLAMAEEILARPKDTVMLVATGSMTNVAILVSLFPEVVEWIKGLVIMGGAVSVGNVTPVAEFNIWVVLCAESILTVRAIPRLRRHCFRSQRSPRNWSWSLLISHTRPSSPRRSRIES